MQKEQLLMTCRKLVRDMETELADNDILDALEDVHQVFVHFKQLEAQIDILSPKEEEKLDEIISILWEIDVDKLKSAKEIIQIIDRISNLLWVFKSKIILWKKEEIMDLMINIRSLLEIIINKI